MRTAEFLHRAWGRSFTFVKPRNEDFFVRELGPGSWGHAREHIEDGAAIGGRPEKVVSAMDGDIQAAGKLLAELREAYRRLPQHVQADVAHLLRESTLQTQPNSTVAS